MPSLAGQSAGEAAVFVRPHALDVRPRHEHPHQFRARIEHVNLAGPTAKVEMSVGTQSIRAEMTQEQFRSLGVGVKGEVYVRPRPEEIFVHPTGDRIPA